VIVREIAIPEMLKLPVLLQLYFQKLRPPADSHCTARDGAFVGNMAVDVAEAAKKSERALVIHTFVMQMAMLRECGCANLDAMLIGTLVTRSFRVRPKDVAMHDPAALSSAEAETIGLGLESILRLSTTHIEAVDELLRKYPALAVTAQQHVWFRTMLETIAKRRMASAPSGLKLRLGIGAGCSMADMLSDIYSIVAMLQSGQAVGAYGMIGLVSASVALQLLVVMLQTKHRSRRAVAWEVFLVFALAKPGADALRVSSGAEQIAGAPMDPFTEMIFTKGIEIAFEAGPGAALQAYIVLSGYWRISAILSVGISCLAIGFTTSMMAFDYDTSPAKRKTSPKFYGYIPDTARGRLLVFVELFTLHTAHAMEKTLTFAMLAQTDWRWLLAYMTADHCVLIIYKITRGDLIYWTPGTSTIPHTTCDTERIICDMNVTSYVTRPPQVSG
jgi:hypothetical protein